MTKASTQAAAADERAPSTRDDRAWRNLSRAVAKRCRGRTLVVGRGAERLAPLLGERGLRVTARRSSHADVGPAPAEPGNGAAHFDTLVLAGLLEHTAEGEADRALARLWPSLRAGGRLVAIVPNADCRPGPDGGGSFDRRDLRKVLQPLGKPRLASEQPFRWLVMHVTKTEPGKPRIKRPVRERYRVTARLCRGRVVDLGCGEGHFAGVLAARGLEVVAVDRSASKIEAARACYPGVAFILSDIRRLDLPDASFDTAVLAEVLEHADEAAGDEILATAWRLLRPGGRLIVSVPNRDCVRHPNHVREFDRRGLKSMLAPFGRPRLVTDQPYKWLMMYVEKGHG
jgi:SAM-dependent methyltransferase